MLSVEFSPDTGGHEQRAREHATCKRQPTAAPVQTSARARTPHADVSE